MSPIRQEPAPVDNDAPHRSRFSTALGRWTLLVVAVIIAATIAALLFTRAATRDQARADELVLAAFASQLSTGDADVLLASSGRLGQIVDDQRSIATFGATDGLDRADRGWLARVAIRAGVDDDRQFQTTAPDGRDWWHSTIRIGEVRFVVSIPTDDAMFPWRTQALVIALLGIAAALIVCALALFLHRSVGRPAQSLAEATAQLRVRGRIQRPAHGVRAIPRATPTELRRAIEDLREIEADLIEGERQIDGLLAAGAQLAASLDERQVLEAILQHLETILAVERAAIVRYDPRVQYAEVVAQRGHDDSFGDELRAGGFPDDTMASVRSIREKRPVQIPDTEAEVVSESLRDRARRHGYRSVLAIPLTPDLTQPTVLLLHARTPRVYSYDEVELSKSFAALGGAALRNAELFASTDSRLRTQTSRLEAIIGSVDQGILVANDAGTVLFANSIMHSLVPAGLAEGDIDSIDRFVAAILAGVEEPSTMVQTIDELAAGTGHCDITIDQGPSGQPLTFRVRRFEVRDTHGRPVGRGQVWDDITNEIELERMKSGLLAAVSHEFRSPLALIKGYATTLLADDVAWEDADRRRFLTHVNNEADRLSLLVQRILDVRRIDAGMVSLQVAPVEVTEIVQTAASSLGDLAARINAHSSIEALVDVDSVRAVTALRNLLENACNYSPDSEPVDVSVDEKADGWIVVSVRDRGAGLDPELRERAFETFVRGDHALNAVQGGVGLGLSITRGFIEAHGGRVWISDPDDGRPGTVFNLSLPRSEAARLGEPV